MKTSIIFLVIFTISALLGVVSDWSSWILGAAFGVSVYDVASRRWLK